MKSVRVVTALSITGVLAAGVLATAVNTQILGAVTAGTESSTESLRITEETVDPARVTPEQTEAAARATAQQASPDSERVVPQVPRTSEVAPSRGSQSLDKDRDVDIPSPVIPEPNITGGTGSASVASTLR